MRLAYLCNLYPAVSHSFVRREIEAVERSGHEVHRFSVRRRRLDLKDPADRREAERLVGQRLGQLKSFFPDGFGSLARQIEQWKERPGTAASEG